MVSQWEGQSEGLSGQVPSYLGAQPGLRLVKHWVIGLSVLVSRILFSWELVSRDVDILGMLELGLDGFKQY